MNCSLGQKNLLRDEVAIVARWAYVVEAQL